MPTRDRPIDQLKAGIDSFRQQLPPDSEIIVVDDGSHKPVQLDDESIIVMYQSAAGPAAARNKGIRQAKGDIVFITGDDIIPHPGLLSEHVSIHEQHPEETVAVLGYTTWGPNLRITPFMKWLENGGPQFRYWSIKNSDDVYYGHLYTCNISLKRSFLMRCGLFDEQFPYAAWEDIELGFRLAKKGLRIIYNNKALAYHSHQTNLSSFMKRMEKAGYSQGLYQEKTDIKFMASTIPVLSRWSRYKYAFLKSLGQLVQYCCLMPKLYAYLCDYQRMKGLMIYASQRITAGSKL